jgi:DNA-binding response OmpR family regulator
VKVLIVDDEPALASLMAELLAKRGYECRLAATLADAALQLPLFKPRFILLDQNLPDGNGISFMSRLDGGAVRPWVALISGALSAEAEKRAAQAGINRCFSKPVNIGDILLAMGHAFEGPPGRP